MNKKIKIMLILIISINIIFSFNIAHATTIGDKILGGGNKFISTAISAGEASNFNGDIAPTITELANLLMGIGVIVLIVTGLIIAIKTMSDGATGRAQLKEALTPYLIGCIIIISAWTIWKIIINIMQ